MNRCYINNSHAWLLIFKSNEKSASKAKSAEVKQLTEAQKIVEEATKKQAKIREAAVYRKSELRT